MRKISAHIVALLAVLPAAGDFLCACSTLDGKESVIRTDVGKKEEDDPDARKPFRIAAESSYDGPSGLYVLDVALTQGADAEYTLLYSLDGKGSGELLQYGGEPFESGSRVLLSRGGAARFVLPDTGGDEGSVTLTVRRGGTSRERTVGYGRAPLALLGRVQEDTGYGCPAVVVKGSKDSGLCTLVFFIDGKTGAGVRILEASTMPAADALEYDFAAYDSPMFLLPNLERGRHEVRLEVSRGSVTDTVVSDWTVE